MFKKEVLKKGPVFNRQILIRNASSNRSPVNRGSGRLSGVKAVPFSELVNEDSDSNPNIQVLSLEDLYKLGHESVRNENSSSRNERLNIDTRKGKTAGDKLLILPDKITSVVSNATVGYNPNRLRSSASKYYLSLAENGAHRPATETIDVDTHLTGIFLQNYASLYNVLKEARQRLGSAWRPNRILDVGFGPATGIVALNEVFNDVEVDDWKPERKLSIVIGHRDMKKRAVSILANQKHEEVTKSINESEEIVDDVTEDEVILTEAERIELNELIESENIQAVEEPQTDESSLDSEPSLNSKSRTKPKPTPIQTVVRQQLPAVGSSSKYDLIIATHQLYRSGYHYPASVDDHTSHLLSLLSPGGVLVLVERGDPTGFETIARARQIMFRPEDHRDVSKYAPRLWKNNENFKLNIVAPCPHHGKCPLQIELGIRNRGKNPAYFNWCKFAQMVQRPKFALELKKGQLLSQKWSLLNTASGKVSGSGGKELSGTGRPFGRSFETATHSYLIVQRNGEEEKENSGLDISLQTTEQPTDSSSWPRILQNPLKRDKHVIMEVCSPSGEVEQWTVTQGYGKEAYHDARKATGGDLWALGAKVVQVRGGNKSKIIKAFAKIRNESKGIKNEEETERIDENETEVANEAIDLAWLKDSTYKSEKTRRKQAYTRGSEPGAYEDVDGGFSDEYFEDLAQVFENKKSRDYEKKLKKSSHVEKKRVMKW